MFIGIAGPICAGKRTIAEFLISNYSFTRLRLRVDPPTPVSSNGGTSSPAGNNVTGLANGVHNLDLKASSDDHVFNSMSEMVGYVTKRWREDFVTVDIWNEKDLEIAIKRPFFLLLSVDAPITIRWKRYRDQYS
jgi:dCMP deaminase